jgi:hypothetical protein
MMEEPFWGIGGGGRRSEVLGGEGGGGGVQKSDSPSLPPLGQGEKGGPHDCNTREG